MVEKSGRTQMIATVERAADVLLLFSNTFSRDLGVTDIAEKLGLSKAAVHRILASLRSRGFIDLNLETRRYRLGASSLALGLSYLESIDLRSMVIPELEALSSASMETATLSIRTGDQRMYVHQVCPAREIVMSVAIGVPYPLHSGSS
ncbi:MAG TPA: helix-turn-helix domain-containing protein, partial [Candidatus Nanopelagicaceae bacterium]